jgi:hypothetical protein
MNDYARPSGHRSPLARLLWSIFGQRRARPKTKSKLAFAVHRDGALEYVQPVSAAT